ncbi:hypothetical protein PIB30_012258 [Stylosanthes scabra]|uniref:CCHC-type domain-containing protein n=1 Tax=Stylosanthes scabra TaxID=79078 RepID=A0ABU6W434_9FABA|nr:hypothetical protein [Stylosanthes scabra]
MGASSQASFDVASEGIVRLCSNVKSRMNGVRRGDEKVSATTFVKDPVVVKTKGAPRIPKNAKGRKRRCGKCRRVGHTKRHCPSDENDFYDGSSLNRPSGSEIPSQGSSPFDQREYSYTSDDKFGTSGFDPPGEKPMASMDSIDSDESLDQMMKKEGAVTDGIMVALKKM